MKRLLYIVWQYTWGLLQNLAGGTIYAFYRLRGCPHFAYQGALAVIWPVRSGSMSLGRFLFLHESYRPGDRALLAHEYGHTIQSLILGPLYLFVIGLPSLLWAGLPVFQRRRHDRHVSYYSFYPEKWANRIARKLTGTEFEILI